MRLTALRKCLERALPTSSPASTTGVSHSPGVVIQITTAGTVQMKQAAVSFLMFNSRAATFNFQEDHTNLVKAIVGLHIKLEKYIFFRTFLFEVSFRAFPPLPLMTNL